jgi:hypothetical protein
MHGGGSVVAEQREKMNGQSITILSVTHNTRRRKRPRLGGCLLSHGLPILWTHEEADQSVYWRELKNYRSNASLLRKLREFLIRQKIMNQSEGLNQHEPRDLPPANTYLRLKEDQRV